VEVAADSVIDEALLLFGLCSCLVFENNIVIPSSFHLQQHARSESIERLEQTLELTKDPKGSLEAGICFELAFQSSN
jgi:hypothetical protein